MVVRTRIRNAMEVNWKSYVPVRKFSSGCSERDLESIILKPQVYFETAPLNLSSCKIEGPQFFGAELVVELEPPAPGAAATKLEAATPLTVFFFLFSNLVNALTVNWIGWKAIHCLPARSVPWSFWCQAEREHCH